MLANSSVLPEDLRCLIILLLEKRSFPPGYGVNSSLLCTHPAFRAVNHKGNRTLMVFSHGLKVTFGHEAGSLALRICIKKILINLL